MRESVEGPLGERYEIKVKGRIDQRWSRWFEGLDVTPLAEGQTLLAGTVRDQAALQGILSRIGDLGLELLLVRRLAPLASENGAEGQEARAGVAQIDGGQAE
ncbi:MAG: hypothetical protein ACYC4L_19450 [Chloroflexota bacterium]